MTKGRLIVARQRQLISEIQARGGDIEDAEELLLAFRRTLIIFEDDLARITNAAEAGSKSLTADGAG